jgi:hypothetical protein
VFPDDETVGDVAIATGSAPEGSVVEPSEVC